MQSCKISTSKFPYVVPMSCLSVHLWNTEIRTTFVYFIFIVYEMFFANWIWFLNTYLILLIEFKPLLGLGYTGKPFYQYASAKFNLSLYSPFCWGAVKQGTEFFKNLFVTCISLCMVKSNKNSYSFRNFHSSYTHNHLSGCKDKWNVPAL